MNISLIESQIGLHKNNEAWLMKLRSQLGRELTEIHMAITKVNTALREVHKDELE